MNLRPDRTPGNRSQARRGWLARLGLAAWVLLGMLAGGLLYSIPAQAEPGARPLPLQTDYPPFATPLSPGDPGYQAPPGDDETPAAGETVLPSPTANSAYPVGTPGTPTPILATPTQTLTPTLPPDVLATENSEMSDSQVTPPGSETPASSITPYLTSTTTRAAGPEGAPVDDQAAGGLRIDWGLFWIGFSMPVLLACGGVLYLLDRRPDLFRRR